MGAGGGEQALPKGDARRPCRRRVGAASGRPRMEDRELGWWVGSMGGGRAGWIFFSSSVRDKKVIRRGTVRDKKAIRRGKLC